MRPLIYISLLLAAGSASATPGDLPERVIENPDPTESLELLDPSSGRSCPERGGVCLFAGARSTSAVESQAVASKKNAPVVSRFRRSDDKHVWTIEVLAALKRAALPGNAVFLLFDADDPDALAAHEYTAMYQTAIKAGRSLSLRLRMSPDEGFRAGHSYRLRVVQLLGNKELELVEATFTLL